MDKKEFIKEIKNKMSVNDTPVSPVKESDFWGPQMTLTSDELPSLNDKDVGDKVRFVVEGEVSSKNDKGESCIKINKVG